MKDAVGSWRLIDIIDWQAENEDDEEHDEAGEEDIEVSIDSVSEHKEWIRLNLLFILVLLYIHPCVESLPQVALERLVGIFFLQTF